MYIRRTLTRSLDTGEHYYSHRLVRSERVAGRVRQVTLLNLGQNFAPGQEQWPGLCQRIEEILAGQAIPLVPGFDSGLEREAQRLAALLLMRQAQPPSSVRAAAPEAMEEMALLDLARARSVGVELVGLWALGELRLAEALRELSVPQRQIAAVLGLIVGRLAAVDMQGMASPCWAADRSAFAELLGVDLSVFSPPALYRARDSLLKHRAEIEAWVASRWLALCGVAGGDAVYDLRRNCPGDMGRASWLQPGDPGTRPSVTLGLVVDSSGLIRRSVSHYGGDAAGRRFKTMLDGLGAPPGALVAIDPMLASPANLAWLLSSGYHYLVVSGETAGPSDGRPADPVRPSLDPCPMPVGNVQEVRLCYRVPDLENRGETPAVRSALRLEAGLRRIAAGLVRPGGERRLDRLGERIRRLKQRSGSLAASYRITLTVAADGEHATGLTWERLAGSGPDGSPRGHCWLRSSAADWDAVRLYDAYRLLRELDSDFAAVAAVRPSDRDGEECGAVQFLVSVLACQCVRLIRSRLAAAGIDADWPVLRQTLAGQVRVTASFRRSDGRTLHARAATLAEPGQLAIYQALGIDAAAGGTQRTVI
jgi:hypothetical protein